MHRRHEEYTDTVTAPPERVFDHLDDQARLSAHMSKRSWKMGWGKMDLRLDDKRGQAVGSRLVLDGRVFGVRLCLDEVVTERVPPVRKTWATIGEPKLLVIGSYRMGFDLSSRGPDTQLRVAIDYDLPATGVSRLLGKWFGRSYARWCTRKMVQDARAAFM